MKKKKALNSIFQFLVRLNSAVWKNEFEELLEDDDEGAGSNKNSFIKAYDSEDGLITDENIIVISVEYNTSSVLLVEVNVKKYIIIKIFFLFNIDGIFYLFIVVDNIYEFSFEKTKKHNFAAHLIFQLFFYRAYIKTR